MIIADLNEEGEQATVAGFKDKRDPGGKQLLMKVMNPEYIAAGCTCPHYEYCKSTMEAAAGAEVSCRHVYSGCDAAEPCFHFGEKAKQAGITPITCLATGHGLTIA